MKLIMFDVDGTLVDSMKIDEKYFEEAIREGLRIEKIDTNWSNYSHATDSCILEEIVKNEFERKIEKDEIESFISAFYRKIDYFIKNNPNGLAEIDGANDFIADLNTKDQYALSIATGGYKEIAKLKLEKAGVNIKNIPISCSHDGISREEIMKSSEKKAKAKYNIEQFEEIIYFGDGIWDYKACKNLNYRFIAIADNEEKFKKYNLSHILKNYEHLESVYNLIVNKL